LNFAQITCPETQSFPTRFGFCHDILSAFAYGLPEQAIFEKRCVGLQSIRTAKGFYNKTLR